jgi:hypothetical protein
VKISFANAGKLAFIKSCFLENNRWKQHVKFDGATVEVLHPKLAALVKRAADDKETALPLGDGNKCFWVAMPDLNGELKVFEEVLKSFIVPCFGFNLSSGSIKTLEEDYGVYGEKTLFPKGYLSFNSSSSLDDKTAQALALGFKVFDSRPSLSIVRPGPSFEVIKSFQESLLSSRWSDAEGHLNEIVSRHLISLINIQFLRIQLFEAMGQWEAILNIPALVNILKSRVPSLVRLAVGKAAYFQNHSELDGAGEFPSSFQVFKEKEPLYCELFRGISPGMHWTLDRLFAFRAVSLNNNELFESLIRGKEEREKNILLVIKALMPSATIPSQITLPQRTKEELFAACVMNCEYNKAFLLAQEVEDKTASAKMLIRVAFESYDQAYLIQTKQAFMRLAAEEKSAILDIPFFSKSIRELDLLDEGPDIVSWNDWLKCLASKVQTASCLKDAAKKIKEVWVPNWGADTSEEFAELLLENITSSDKNLMSAVSDCYPFILCSFIEDEKFPDVILKEAYKALFEVAVQVLPCSIERAFYVLQLAEGILELDPHFSVSIQTEYLPWIKSFSMNQKYAEAAYDLIEILLCLGVPGENLVSLWTSAASFLKRTPSFESLAYKYGIWREIGICCGLSQESVEEYFFNKDLGGVERKEDRCLSEARVAIFTLMPSSAERVSKALKSKYPNIQVDINDDLVSTDRLKALAARAEPVVLVTQSMKHAVFYKISAMISSKKIVYPKGRGSSSILESIYSWARDS